MNKGQRVTGGGVESELVRLLHASLAGDEQAYREFLRRAALIVRAVAQRKVGKGPIDPEDIVQETLLAVHLKRHTWRREAPVTPWLHAIARHKLIDAFRRRGRRVEITIEETVEWLAVEEVESARPWEIERALRILTPARRAVVSAISVEGRSVGETAQILGMTEAAVRVALHRGLKEIEKRFGRSQNED